MKVKNKLIRILLVIVIALFCRSAYVGYQIYSYASVNTKKQADAALVLGAAVWGNQPSPVFRQRINHAILLYKRQQIRKIIFTGGKGDLKLYTESEIAKKYALNQGVAENDIILESSSKSTIENIQYSLPLMKKNKLASILLVSDPLHMKRSMMIAKDFKLTVYSSPTLTSQYQRFSSQFKFLLRETYFYQRYQLFQY